VAIIDAMRVALVAIVAVVALAAAGSGGATSHTLIARVGLHDTYTISLKWPNGMPVVTVPAGTYTIVVHDYSRFHNFALGSQTENKRIFTGGIRWIGTRSYTVDLTPGNYAYACSVHFQTMNGTFVVTPT
jgi:plastocyanin